MKESILVYYAVMQKFIAYAALATFFLSVGMAVDGQTGTGANFVRAFCIIWSVLIFIALAAWVWHEGHAQAKQHEMQMALLQADIDSIAPPAPEAAPLVSEKMKGPPFMPEGFVKFIWDWRDQTKKFPTVKECIESGNHYSIDSVQEWYGNAVALGALIGRTRGQWAGDPADDWPRARWEKQAQDSKTLTVT